MRIFKRILLGLLLAIVLAAAWVTYQLRSVPDLGAYAARVLPGAEKRPAALRVTFLGVSTLLIDDGETAILTDGFFTRPSGRDVVMLRKIMPDKALIARHLARAGVSKLAAVIVCHSHYDHAMDAPEVAMQTGAVLVGSESTANIGRGWGMPEDRILVKRAGDTMRFGKFSVTLLASSHISPGYPGGEIMQPLVPPVRAIDYLVGTAYLVLVEHGGKSVLISASAGFVPGALAGKRVDTVFLGVGALGKRDTSYMEAYWREMVATTGARRVIPIHWDNFLLPLDEPLQPSPHLFDDLDATMRFLIAKGAAQNVEVKLPQVWQAMDPFGDGR